jgi:hypothetical protein
MAVFNNGFPATYQPMYYQPQYQPQFQQQQPVQQQMQQIQQQPVQQMQQATQQYPVVQSGFVRVMNENEARMYPVAPGNSVTFINENSPYCYTKTVNMGQLDRPIFEKYRLVKEDDNPVNADATQRPNEIPVPDLSKYAMKDDMDAFRADLEMFKADIETFRSDLYGLAGKKKAPPKKEVAINE